MVPPFSLDRVSFIDVHISSPFGSKERSSHPQHARSHFPLVRDFAVNWSFLRNADALYVHFRLLSLLGSRPVWPEVSAQLAGERTPLD